MAIKEGEGVGLDTTALEGLKNLGEKAVLHGYGSDDMGGICNHKQVSFTAYQEAILKHKK